MSQRTGQPANHAAGASPTEAALQAESGVSTTPPTKPMGDVVVRGAAWTSIAWGIGTVASLGAQLVLGWKLSKEDFARLGTIMTIAVLFTTLADAGLRKVLVSRPREIGVNAWPAFVIALIFNSIVVLALLSFTRWGAPAYFGRDDLMPLAWMFAAMIFVGSFGVSQSAILSIDQRFKWVAGVTAVGNVGRHLAVVILAFAGVGVYAYVVPMVLILFFNLAASLYQVGWIPRRPAPASVYRSMLRGSAWIQVGAFAAMLAMTGDYWVGGRALSEADFGLYYFGFQLAQSASAAVSSVLISVLTPTFALLHQDADRRRGAVRSSNSLVSSLLMLATLLGVMISPLAVHLVWHGKWDGSIIVVQAVMPLLWSRSLFTIGQSVLDAGAHWILSLVLTLAYSATLVGGAVLGVWLGGFGGFLAAVAAAHLLNTLATNLLATRLVGCTTSQWTRDALLPLVVALSVFLTYAAATWMTHRPLTSPWWSAAWSPAVGGVYVALLALVSPSHWEQVKNLASRFKRTSQKESA
jgi:O-antigen/teichoic acid export membrane protein